MRVLNESGDSCEVGVDSHTSCLHHQSAEGVDSGTHHRIAGTDFHRHRFPGEQTDIHGRFTIDHSTVCCHLFSGAHEKVISHGEFVDGNRPFTPVTHHRDILGAKGQQRGEGPAASALGANFEIPTEQDEGGDSRSDLQIDLAVAGALGGQHVEVHAHSRIACSPEEERIQRPHEGRAYA